MLGSGVSSRIALEVPLSVDLDWVESIGVHLRWIEHYVIHCAVTE